MAEFQTKEIQNWILSDTGTKLPKLSAMLYCSQLTILQTSAAICYHALQSTHAEKQL
jgi:hypothetical protein